VAHICKILCYVAGEDYAQVCSILSAGHTSGQLFVCLPKNIRPWITYRTM